MRLVFFCGGSEQLDVNVTVGLLLLWYWAADSKTGSSVAVCHLRGHSGQLKSHSSVAVCLAV